MWYSSFALALGTSKTMVTNTATGYAIARRTSIRRAAASKRWSRMASSQQVGGIAALVPKYPKERASRLAEDLVQLISHARAPRTRIWPCRVHKRATCV